MMPKTSVSPAARRNSSSPNCTPLRHCSMKSVIVVPDARSRNTNGGSARCRHLWHIRPSFHLALRRVRVRHVLFGRGDGLLSVCVTLFNHLLHVEVLRRIVVGAEFKVAAYRFE